MPAAADSVSPARLRVADALAPAAALFPELDPQTLDTADLAPRDAALALAVQRTVLQRWLTLEHLLNHFLKRELQSLEPALQAVLLTGAAQLLAFDRMPRHSVVDESVAIARQLVRPGAHGLVNAVLRRLADAIGPLQRDQTWSPAPNAIPMDGGIRTLTAPLLPALGSDRETDLAEHLAAATSHPARLVRRWIDLHGRAAAIALCEHGSLTPPTLVAVEDEFAFTPSELWRKHEQDGFIVWDGAHGDLVAFLEAHPARRVQDPAAAAVLACTRGLPIRTAIDYCAGRGTKSRQLLTLHPQATVYATDTDETRRRVLHESAQHRPRLEVVRPEMLQRDDVPPADLLLLDVPCSNTGVLARRPEARYRFRSQSLQSLVQLQRDIAALTAPLMSGSGHLLYSTCSVEPQENQDQARWIALALNLDIVHEQLILPAGRDTTYHDGGYHVLLRK